MLKVCRTWWTCSRTDPELWRFLVVTCEVIEGGNSPALAPQRRLPQTHGEYAPSRAALEGALPLTLEQLINIPNPSFVETIVFARDWAALPNLREEEAWFEAMRVLLGKLPAMPCVRKLRLPLFFLHRPAMVALATWMRTLTSVEYLDLPLDNDDDGLLVWTSVWHEGVIEPTSRLRSRRHPWEWSVDLPRLFPRLRGISRLWAHRVTPEIVRSWPLAFRSQIEIVEVEQGERHGWGEAELWSLGELFPYLSRLLISWHEFDDASPDWSSLLSSLAGALPPTLKALYLSLGDDFYDADTPLLMPSAEADDWDSFERVGGLEELCIVCNDGMLWPDVTGPDAAPDNDASGPRAACAKLSSLLPLTNVLVCSDHDHRWLRRAQTPHPRRPNDCPLDAMQRQFLPGMLEAWHMAAVPPSLPNRPELRGPLTKGSAPPSWLADISRAKTVARRLRREGLDEGGAHGVDPWAAEEVFHQWMAPPGFGPGWGAGWEAHMQMQMHAMGMQILIHGGMPPFPPPFPPPIPPPLLNHVVGGPPFLLPPLPHPAGHANVDADD